MLLDSCQDSRARDGLKGIDGIQRKDAVGGAVLGEGAKSVDNHLAPVGDCHPELKGHEMVPKPPSELDARGAADEAAKCEADRNRPDSVGLLAWLGLAEGDQPARGEHAVKYVWQPPRDDQLAHLVEPVEGGSGGVGKACLEELVRAAVEVNACAFPSSAKGPTKNRGVESKGSIRPRVTMCRRTDVIPWGGMKSHQLL